MKNVLDRAVASEKLKFNKFLDIAAELAEMPYAGASDIYGVISRIIRRYVRKGHPHFYDAWAPEWLHVADGLEAMARAEPAVREPIKDVDLQSQHVVLVIHSAVANLDNNIRYQLGDTDSNGANEGELTVAERIKVIQKTVGWLASNYRQTFIALGAYVAVSQVLARLEGLWHKLGEGDYDTKMGAGTFPSTGHEPFSW